MSNPYEPNDCHQCESSPHAYFMQPIDEVFAAIVLAMSAVILLPTVVAFLPTFVAAHAVKLLLEFTK